MRILYSFPYALGAAGVGTTAVQQVLGLGERGHDLTVFSPSVHPSAPPLPAKINTTMMVGGMRVPHRVLGMDRSMALHDVRVARHLRQNADAYDVVHCWPGVALETSRAAAEVGIPALREVPNTHTGNAYEVMAELCEQLGLTLPRGHSHRMNVGRLHREELEYETARKLLVPSDHVRSTFLERGFAPEKLIRHRYGFDPQTFRPGPERGDRPFKAVFLGTVDPRKGLHIALEAWRRAGAYRKGNLEIYGHLVDGYDSLIQRYLSLPNVVLNEFTSNAAAVLQDADVLLLPSFEEGSALVTYEAQGSGVVPVVSDAAGAMCVDGVTGLVHSPGDIDALAGHISALINDPALLQRLRKGVLEQRDRLTWAAAAERLETCYAEALAEP